MILKLINKIKFNSSGFHILLTRQKQPVPYVYDRRNLHFIFHYNIYTISEDPQID